MTIKEKKELCSKALIAWFATEAKGEVVGDKDIADMFISKMLRKKFEVFDINIVLPDMLLLILSICTDGNPGVTQVLVKEILESIKSHKGPIPSGYVIDSMDFSLCYPMEFPILDAPGMYDKYLEIWDGQKYQTQFGLNNKCDTVEWWKEVMKDESK